MHLSFGLLLATTGEPKRGLAEVQVGLELSRADGDTWSEAFGLGILGEAALHAGDLDAAEGHLARALDMERALGDEYWLASWLSTAGDVARCRGEHAQAESRYREALERYAGVGVQRPPAHLLRNLGYVALQRGNTRAAATWTADSLEQCQLTGERQGIAECLAAAAGVAVAQGEFDTGARWLGAAERLLRELDGELWVGNRPYWEATLCAAGEQLGEAGLTGARNAGASQPLEPVVAEILSWAPHGRGGTNRRTRPGHGQLRAEPPSARAVTVAGQTATR